MSTFELQVIGVIILVGFNLAVLCIVWPARRRKDEVKAPIEMGAPVHMTFDSEQAYRETNNKLIQSFSERLAAAEGRLTAFAAQQEGFAVIRQRVDAMESHMPSLQSAMEQYADQIGRADKRETERKRRSDKSAQTAGEAAAQMAHAGGGEGAQPSATPSPASNNKRAGVLGGNRNR